jgi:hypothetical protein
VEKNMFYFQVQITLVLHFTAIGDLFTDSPLYIHWKGIDPTYKAG